MSTPQWSEARRILCVRLDTLGDVLMCTPAMRALREQRPDRTVTLLTSGIGAAVARYIPEVDDTLIYRPPWMKHDTVQGADYQLAMVRQLREAAFDAAVIFTTCTQSALPAAMLCYLAEIPLRLAHCRENPYDLLTDWVPETDLDARLGIRHEVQRQLDLVEAVGCRASHTRLSFRVPDSAKEEAGLMLAELGITPRQPWILMHPGASAASRRYPPRHWAALVRMVHQQLGLPVVLTGDDAEKTLIDEIRAQSGIAPRDAVSLAGQLDLAQLAAVIQLASVAVSNNTGPAHIAAAVGTPIVDLYALTNPQHTPWQVESRVLYHDVPCRYCYKSTCPQGHHACLEQLEPAEVLAAIQELLSPGNGVLQRESGTAKLMQA
jgi:lipopolysaccharide heptosyltransferase II